MNNHERIYELLEIMKEHGLVELEFQEGDFKVRLAKQQVGMGSIPVSHTSETSGEVEQDSDNIADNMLTINSPIVGTFYHSPAPDAEAFVKVGDTVTPDGLVCIIEAMKVMNEVKAELSGIIAEILVENGEAVEYGQPLFRVRPN